MGSLHCHFLIYFDFFPDGVWVLAVSIYDNLFAIYFYFNNEIWAFDFNWICLMGDSLYNALSFQFWFIPLFHDKWKLFVIYANQNELSTLLLLLPLHFHQKLRTIFGNSHDFLICFVCGSRCSQQIHPALTLILPTALEQ